jgi:hypothetical protein
MDSFVDTWASHGGNLSIVCTNTDKAQPVIHEAPPPAEDSLESAPAIAQADEEEPVAEETIQEGFPEAAGPVAESAVALARRPIRASLSPSKGAADTEARWWDSWFEDVMYDRSPGEVAEDAMMDDDEAENAFDMEDLVDELSIRSLQKQCDGRPGPVAEALDGLMDMAKQHGNLQGMMSSARNSIGRVSSSTGNMSQAFNSMAKPGNLTGGLLQAVATATEPDLVVDDPFLADREEYPGEPRYIMETNVAPFSSAEIDSLIAKIDPSSRRIPDEPPLQGTAVRMRNMFWYNKAMSPAEFPLKAGQWRRVEKATAQRLKALQKGKRYRVGKNNLPDRPALKSSTALLLAVRIGRASTLRKLLSIR